MRGGTLLRLGRVKGEDLYRSLGFTFSRRDFCGREDVGTGHIPLNKKVSRDFFEPIEDSNSN